MATGVRIQILGEERLRRVLEAATPAQQDRWLREYLTRSGLLILDNAARKQIRRGGAVASIGPRGGRSIRALPPLAKRLTSRTGTLRRSLGPSEGLDRSGLPGFVEVGTALRYGAVHEFGGTIRRVSSRGLAHTATYPRRPFLQPAVDAVSPRLEGLGIQLWERQIARAG